MSLASIGICDRFDARLKIIKWAVLVMTERQNAFKQAFERSVNNALATARELGAVNHSGAKGNLRELVVSELLKPILPPDVRIGTGQIVSSDGTQSPQIDAVLYAPHILPAFVLGMTGLFPIES
jgi:hypothetical protein